MNVLEDRPITQPQFRTPAEPTELWAQGSLKPFDLEWTGVTQPKRLEWLFGLVAWISLLRVGV
ncbi:hypothetical protein GCM10022631_00690 [Deinococcus rubellus]|uniref:hypothetical protein n=1 Tax=Deinococcus rubellus TaxID=1889240 RepID=UPI0031EA1FAA